jgi:hypothetical protein
MWTVIVSPGFISSVRELAVIVARSARCGLGGRAGTPPVWMNAKLTGSGQRGLQWPLPLPWHSRLSMFSAAHQWVLSQLIASENGANPGG